MSTEASATQVTQSLLNQDGTRSLAICLLIAAASLSVLLLKPMLFPTYDSREPPVLRPRIPFIGHIISLIRECGGFYIALYNKYNLPICTLQLLNRKMYVINTHNLVNAAMRSKDLSFDPISMEFSEKFLGLKHETIVKAEQSEDVEEMVRMHHAYMNGEYLSSMNSKAFEEIGRILNDVKSGEELRIPDVFAWLREIIFRATMLAVFGESNPITPEDFEYMNEYEDGLLIIALDLFPKIFARKAVKARGEFQKLLISYFSTRLDKNPDAAKIIKYRADLGRRCGFAEDELGRWELVIPWVGTTNTVPTLFWYFVNVFSRPEYVERIRSEVERLTTRETSSKGITATLDITRLEKECPFLNACYQESQRLYNDNTGTRRVLRDTTLRDVDGKEYLLKKGETVQWYSGLIHHDEKVWGATADIFDPERFIDKTAEDDKKRRGALIPFGGGKTLCPGRNFALAELYGIVATIAVGFEVDGAQVPRSNLGEIGRAIRLPIWDSMSRNIKLTRRKGWETVQWEFFC